MQSNACTVTNALECIENARCASPQASLRMHHTTSGGVAVGAECVNVADIVWAAVLQEEEHCPHCKMDSCLLEDNEEEPVHHGDGLVANGEMPCTI